MTKTYLNFVGNTLGVIVEAIAVRLIPNVEDGYIWVRQPESEHLFSRQMSKHSIRAYMELYQEVGSSFNAALRRDPNPEIVESMGNELPQDVSSTINDLKVENARLVDELSRLKDTFQDESLVREHAEQRTRQLEGDLSAAIAQADKLRRKNQILSLRMKRVARGLGYSDKEVRNAFTMLYKSG